MIEEIKNSDFTDVLKSKLAVVDFSAVWCGPCQMMHPILQELKEKVGETARILKIDVDKNMELAAEFNVQSVPTLIVFKEGTVRWRQSGVQRADALAKILSEVAGS